MKHLTPLPQRALIVGSGPSAKDLVTPESVRIIAVNGVIDWIDRADYFFTLDLSRANLSRICRPRKGVTYTAAVPAGSVLPAHVMRFERRCASGLQEPSSRGTPEWWLWRWSGITGLSEDKQVIHTGNSAYGALGLAYHLGFREVAIIGVDGTKAERVEGGHSGNLSHLPLLISSARHQMNIVNCGKLSTMPYVPLSQWLKSRAPVISNVV